MIVKGEENQIHVNCITCTSNTVIIKTKVMLKGQLKTINLVVIILCLRVVQIAHRSVQKEVCSFKMEGPK